ncbi:MAG: indolepyruvate ferredoxin oxidoreductase subunit alpha [Fusobacteriaceae bacterium]
MAHKISKEECITCGAWKSVCPVSCISEVEDRKRQIDKNTCIDCGACASICPIFCISQV